MENPKAEELKRRTRRFASRVITLVTALPRGPVADVIGRQLLRSGTSVGANYRAACRARSNRDFLAKLGIVEEEADETLYWLELIVENGIVAEPLVKDLMNEAEQLLAITVSSIQTARNSRREWPVRQSAIRNPQSAIAR